MTHDELPGGDRVSESEQTRIYEGLLAGDAASPYDLFSAFFLPLTGALIKKLHDLREPDVVENAVMDTLQNFPSKLSLYDPSRGKLWSYLYADAHGDILNELARLRRIEQRRDQAGLGSVEDSLPDRNTDVEADALERIEPRINDFLPPGVEMDTVLAQVRSILVNPDDERILLLMLDGERRTEPYAEALGIADRPIDEQRRDVKRHKDRIGKRLTRLKDSFK